MQCQKQGMRSTSCCSAANWSIVLFHPSSYRTLTSLIGGWLIASRHHQACPPTQTHHGSQLCRDRPGLGRGTTRTNPASSIASGQAHAHTKDASWPRSTQGLWTWVVFLRTRGLQMSPACFIMVSRIGHEAGSRAGQRSCLGQRRECIEA